MKIQIVYLVEYSFCIKYYVKNEDFGFFSEKFWGKKIISEDNVKNVSGSQTQVGDFPQPFLREGEALMLALGTGLWCQSSPADTKGRPALSVIS